MRGSLAVARPGQRSAFLCVGASDDSGRHRAAELVSYGVATHALPSCSPGIAESLEAGSLMAPHLVYAAGPIFLDDAPNVAAGLGAPCTAVRAAGQLLADEQVRTLIVDVSYGESPQSDFALELRARVLILTLLTH